MSELSELIVREIKSTGPITFERFMEQALYHPRCGYYMTAGEKIGSRGDFYTAPAVNTLFGAMLARQLYQMWLAEGSPKQWTIVECGPGTGHLARDIMSALHKEQPDLYAALDYCLIEVSAYLIEVQRQTIEAGIAENSKYRWLSSFSEISDLKGCILANELVDALPVHLVEQTAQGLQELYVAVQENGDLILKLGPLSTPGLAECFELQNCCLAEGQRAEVNLRARQWLIEAVNSLQKGHLIIIDYGAETEELYACQRMDGTLRCFYKHQLIENPFLNIGQQDITAHVNFSLLSLWGKQLGLTVKKVISQPEFLLQMGLFDLLRSQTDYLKGPETAEVVSAIKKLVLPGGMGSIFKVSIMDKL